jgi:hypothetical protein
VLHAHVSGLQALEAMLSAVRGEAKRVITVFGCRGEEDRSVSGLSGAWPEKVSWHFWRPQVLSPGVGKTSRCACHPS